MTPKQTERMTELCTQISQEQNHTKILELVRELNELLSEKVQRLEAMGHHDVMQEHERMTSWQSTKPSST